MPYTTSPPKRYRRVDKRKRTYSRKDDTAYKALALARRVNTRVAGEKKYKDITGFWSIGTTPTATTAWTGIAQGSTSSTREGAQVKAARLYGHALFLRESAMTTTGLVRMVIFRSHNERGTVPTFADIFGTVTAYGLVLNQQVWNTRRENTIMLDKLIRIEPNNDSADTIMTIPFDFRLSHKIRFEAGTNFTSDGGIFVVFVSNNNITPIQCNVQARLIYYDN